MPWYDDPGVPPLVRQLITLRDVGVLGLRSRAVKGLGLILDKAGKLRGQTDSDYKAVRRLVRAAIEGIEDKNYREAARWEFQVHESSGGMSSKARRERAADALAISFERYRKNAEYERGVIAWVAREIERVEREAVAAAASAEERTTDWDRPYIRRDAPEEQFLKATQSGRLIILYGEGGTGKSRLARHLLYRSTDRMLLQAEDEQRLLMGIYEALMDRDVPAASLSNVALKLEFRKLLAQASQASCVVLIDNVEDDGVLVDQLVPEALQALVVARVLVPMG